MVLLVVLDELFEGTLDGGVVIFAVLEVEPIFLNKLSGVSVVDELSEEVDAEVDLVVVEETRVLLDGVVGVEEVKVGLVLVETESNVDAVVAVDASSDIKDVVVDSVEETEIEEDEVC